MLNPVNVEEVRGYRIEIGIDVLPTDIRSSINNMNVWLEQHKDLKIVSKDDYIGMANKLKVVKRFSNKIEDCENGLLKPIDDLRNKIIGEFRPIKQNRNYTESCMKMTMINWSAEMQRKRNEEKAEKLKKAKEEEAIIKKVLQEESIEEHTKVDLLEAQKKTEVEKRRDLEIKKIEGDKKVLQITKQIGEAKEKVNKDSSNAEEIGKEIETLEGQKNIIEDTIKNIETDLYNVKGNIKTISKKEAVINIYARKLAVEKDALVIAPGQPLTERVPKVNGIVYAKLLKYRITDINLVPKEWTNVVITVDDKKVREALRLKGKNLNIPGIDVYEEDSLRSSLY